MKLVIDIPEQMYLNAKKDMLCGSDILVSAIKTGTPLPKGHGRLIDAYDMKDIEFINKGDFNSIRTIREWIDSAPTIIEAENEAEDLVNLDSMLEDLWNATESEEEVCSNNFIQLKQDVLNNKQLWRKLREIEDEDSD